MSASNKKKKINKKKNTKTSKSTVSKKMSSNEPLPRLVSFHDSEANATNDNTTAVRSVSPPSILRVRDEDDDDTDCEGDAFVGLGEGESTSVALPSDDHKMETLCDVGQAIANSQSQTDAVSKIVKKKLRCPMRFQFSEAATDFLIEFLEDHQNSTGLPISFGDTLQAMRPFELAAKKMNAKYHLEEVGAQLITAKRCFARLKNIKHNKIKPMLNALTAQLPQLLRPIIIKNRSNPLYNYLPSAKDITAYVKKMETLVKISSNALYFTMGSEEEEKALAPEMFTNAEAKPFIVRELKEQIDGWLHEYPPDGAERLLEWGQRLTNLTRVKKGRLNEAERRITPTADESFYEKKYENELHSSSSSAAATSSHTQSVSAKAEVAPFISAESPKAKRFKAGDRAAKADGALASMANAFSTMAKSMLATTTSSSSSSSSSTATLTSSSSSSSHDARRDSELCNMYLEDFLEMEHKWTDVCDVCSISVARHKRSPHTMNL